MPTNTMRPPFALPGGRGLRCLALVAALLLPLPLSAAGKADEADGAAPASAAEFADLWARSTPLVTLLQAPGQSDEAFLHEVAAAVDALTDALAAEVCGVFEQDEDAMRVVILLMTQGSPAFCLHPKPTADRARSTLVGASIHSHVDARAGRRAPPRGARLMGPKFSAMDVAAGPGYLVHRGRLWHQRGLGTQRYVARIDTASTSLDARFASRPLIGRDPPCA